MVSKTIEMVEEELRRLDENWLDTRYERSRDYWTEFQTRPSPEFCRKKAKKDGVTLEAMCADCTECKEWREYERAEKANDRDLEQAFEDRKLALTAEARRAEEIKPEYDKCKSDYEIGLLLSKYSGTSNIRRLHPLGKELLQKIKRGEINADTPNLSDLV